MVSGTRAGGEFARVPDGRGASPPPRPRVFGPGFLIFFLMLLLVNIVLTSTLQTQPTRVRIPYSPTFLTQVNAGNVSSISSKGTTVQGNFRTAVRYPANSTATPTKLFVTEIPEFAEQQRAAGATAVQGGRDQRDIAVDGTSVFVTLLLSFGPALLIVLLFVWMMRRAAGGIGGGVSAFGRSRAQRVEPSEQHVTFEDVAGIDEAKEELTEIVDFLKDPQKYRRLGGRIPRGRAADRTARDGQDAAGAGARRRGAGAVLLDLGLGVRRVVRRRRGLAGARSVPAGQGGGAGDHLHRRARRDRPLARRRDRRVRRRSRRARADAQPDPDRDGRLRPLGRRDRDLRHQPTRGARSGAAASRPLRPASGRAATGHGGAAQDPRGAHPLGARSPTTSTSIASPPRRPGWSAPTSPTSSTRRR